MNRVKMALVLFASAALGLSACAGADGQDGQSCTVIESAEGNDITVECEDGTSATLTDGTDGSACTVADNGDGTKTISCEDGTSVTVSDGADGADGADGENGADGSSCTVADNGDGTSTITCEDGTSATVSDGADGENGQDGSSCTVTDNGDGTKTISCDDGTSVTVSDGADGENGQDGSSCTVTDNGNGTATISCDDGTSATVSDGTNGTNGTSCTVTENGDGSATISCDDGTSATVDGLATNSFTFPDAGDSTNLNSNNYMWLTSHFIEGTRTISSSGPVVQVEINAQLSNILSCDDLDLNVSVNGTVYESVTLTDSDFNFQVTIAELIPVQPNNQVTVRLQPSRNVGSGCGSVRFDSGTLDITAL